VAGKHHLDPKGADKEIPTRKRKSNEKSGQKEKKRKANITKRKEGMGLHKRN